MSYKYGLDVNNSRQIVAACHSKCRIDRNSFVDDTVGADFSGKEAQVLKIGEKGIVVRFYVAKHVCLQVSYL